MGFFEWLAVIGAAAWVPQIIAAVYRFAVKPKVHIIPVRQAELTYNQLGPVFNLRASLVVERKDAVIIEMTASFRHPNGREIRLVWDSFVENFSEMTTHDGERGEFARDQIATALKVNTVLPTEKLFRFRDPDFQRQYREASERADDALNRIDQSDRGAVDAFLRSREFSDLISLYNNKFPWEPGVYDVTLGIRLLGRKPEYVAKTKLGLSQDEVDRIRQNLALQEQRLREVAGRVPAEEQTLPRFWASPEVRTKSLTLKKA